MVKQTIRTTVSLPESLLTTVDRLVQEGKVRSRNQLILEAIASKIKAIETAEIDAAFAPMEEDSAYHTEALQIEAEFATASWEALKIGENQL